MCVAVGGFLAQVMTKGGSRRLVWKDSILGTRMQSYQYFKAGSLDRNYPW